MANPRKFSEKIALHHQKQAEETAAFEAIMREVSGATRGAFQKHLHITQNLGAYRGGSLPNVNQMTSNSGILQTALQNLKDIEQGKAGHRDRSRPIIAQQRGGRGFSTRTDCSPYGAAAYLSPPPDTSWRRTNSDSALHTSTMGQQLEHILSSNTPPTHRRVLQVAEENSVQDSMKYWDPKKLGQVRPKSCEVPNINIYPSQEQESGIHIPISNHAGSLPDLSVLQFPSPLSTPLDDEEQNFTSPGSAGSNVNLSPSLISPTQASPPQQSVSARRNLQSSPSPLVLTNVNQMRLPLSPPVTCVDPNSGMSGVSGSAPVQTSSLVRHCMFPQVPQRQHPHGGGGGGGGGQHQVAAAARQQSPTHRHLKTYSPPPPSSLNPCIHHPHHHPGQMQQSSSSSSHQSHPHQSQSIHQHHITPQVHVTPPPCNESHAHQPKPSLTQYRNSESTCQSPTSPLSQTSYSPVQSPGLPPTSTSLEGGGGGGTFSDAFYIQQNTNQIQHQLEQFTMLPDSQPSTLSSVNSNSLGNLSSYQISPQSFELTDEDFQRLAAATSGNQEFNVSSFYPSDLSSLCAQSQQQQLLNTISTQQSSPQHQTGHQNQLQQQQQSSPNHLQQQQQHQQQQQQQSSQQQHQQQQQLSPQTSNKIPHIIFTGADDFSRQDFAKELGNAITGFNDFESDFFPGEETWKMGLDPLDLDAVQMLTDPNLITDAATEDSFKLDRQ